MSQSNYNQIISKSLYRYYLKLKRERRKKAAMKFFGENRPVNLLILGTQKGGTASLSHFLDQHPNCLSPENGKETRYFSQLYDKGNHFFHSHFLEVKKEENNIDCFYEATPENLFDASVPRRVFKYNAQMKFVVLLRDPIKRAYSAWNMWMQFREKNPQKRWNWYSGFATLAGKKNMHRLLFEDGDNSFEYWVKRELKILESEKKNNDFPFFVRRGLYAEQLKRYFKLFQKDNFLIYENKELKRNPIKVLKEIEQLLDIKPHDWESLKLKDKHVRKYRKQIDSSIVAELSQFYKPGNEELFELLGLSYDWK